MHPFARKACLWLAPLLVTPVAAMAALSGPEAAPVADPIVLVANAPAAPAERGALYQVRCWQYGRLLFEETDVVLPANLAPFAVKLRGVDGRHGGAVVVAETASATCLLRSRGAGGPGAAR